MKRIAIETYTKTDYKGGKREVTIYAERTAIGTLYTYHSDYEPARDRYENTDAGENAWFRDCIIKDKEFDSFAELASKNGWVSKDAKVRTGEITEADVEAMLDAAEADDAEYRRSVKAIAYAFEVESADNAHGYAAAAALKYGKTTTDVLRDVKRHREEAIYA